MSRFYHHIYLSLNKELKYFDRIKGHLYLNEGVLLYRLARKLPEKGTIVEIGAYRGKSTCFIAEGIKNRDVTFYTIDTFENQGMSEGLRDTFKEFRKNTLKYKDKIIVKKGFSYDVVKELKNIKIDLLWIDACHEYEAVKSDIEDWLPLVKKNGLLCFHDYYIEGPTHRVKRAVDEAIAEDKLKKLKMIGDRMIITRKVPVNED